MYIYIYTYIYIYIYINIISLKKILKKIIHLEVVTPLSLRKKEKICLKGMGMFASFMSTYLATTFVTIQHNAFSNTAPSILKREAQRFKSTLQSAIFP